MQKNACVVHVATSKRLNNPSTQKNRLRQRRAELCARKNVAKPEQACFAHKENAEGYRGPALQTRCFMPLLLNWMTSPSRSQEEGEVIQNEALSFIFEYFMCRLLQDQARGSNEACG